MMGYNVWKEFVSGSCNCPTLTKQTWEKHLDIYLIDYPRNADGDDGDNFGDFEKILLLVNVHFCFGRLERVRIGWDENEHNLRRED
jgi:hypothetical protein